MKTTAVAKSVAWAAVAATSTLDVFVWVAYFDSANQKFVVEVLILVVSLKICPCRCGLYLLKCSLLKRFDECGKIGAVVPLYLSLHKAGLLAHYWRHLSIH